MVERLKIAVAKARAQRARLSEQPEAQGAAVPPAAVEHAVQSAPVQDAAVAEAPRPAEGAQPAPAPAMGAFSRDTPHSAGVVPSGPPTPAVLRAWEALEPISFDHDHLERNRIITVTKEDPTHVAFDVLRTRILSEFKKRGWTRLGITSPTKGCGKTFVSTNLAMSLARQDESRTILFDMDLRAPSIAKVLGHRDPMKTEDFFSGEIPAKDFLRRHGNSLAIGFNARRINGAGEAILSTATADALDGMRKTYKPDIVVYDLPPMLVCDDVLGFLPHLDCVLMVVGGGVSQASEVQECERMLEGQTSLLGVMLNRAEVSASGQYGYYYGYGYGYGYGDE